MVAFVLTYFVLDVQINKNPAIQKVVVALIACVTPLGAVGILAGFIFVVFGVSLFVLTLPCTISGVVVKSDQILPFSGTNLVLCATDYGFGAFYGSLLLMR